jgi:hypothetical protein
MENRELSNPEVRYPCTNESLEAIIAGLQLSKRDIVVCIAGSGDVPFAIAPHVKYVFAVDRDGAQIDFIKQQRELLRAGRFNDFLRLHLLLAECAHLYGVNEVNIQQRADYFKEKFYGVQQAVGKIETRCEDIFVFLRASFGRWCHFDKLYLSNVLQANMLELNSDAFVDSLRGLREGGIIYDASSMQVNRRDFSELQRYLPAGLVVDLDLTYAARERENSPLGWSPAVYRKTNDVKKILK